MDKKLHAAVIHTAWFHFYNELNDFLPELKRGIIFPLQFTGSQPIKDLIESIGIPHTEIDLIFVNGQAADFSYRVCGGERVAVYPQCALSGSMPLVHLLPEPLPEIKFIVDVNLGKLASKLRLLGFDTLYKNDFTDSEIVGCSLREQRIILTRDKGILKYRVVKYGYWVRNDAPKKQLKEVLMRLQLLPYVDLFTRCSQCNTLLQHIDKTLIKEHLSDNTLHFVDDFMYCPGCKKIYWQGSHAQRFRKDMDELSRH